MHPSNKTDYQGFPQIDYGDCCEYAIFTQPKGGEHWTVFIDNLDKLPTQACGSQIKLFYVLRLFL